MRTSHPNPNVPHPNRLYRWALVGSTLLLISTTGVTRHGVAVTATAASDVSQRELRGEYVFVGTTTIACEALFLLQRSGLRHLTSIVTE